MELFKFLKKKREQTIEMLLQKAADEPAYRAEFIKRLLTEKFILITKGVAQEGFIKFKEGTKLSIFTFSDGKVPIFTSSERIYDKGIIKEQVDIISAKGEDIFGMLKGKALLLNPYSDYGKEFSPQEVERILNGTYFDVKAITYKKTTQVHLGQPSKYPIEIVKSLNELFLNKPDVVAAYLGWFHDPTTSDPPHYIFAVETKGEWADICDDLKLTIEGHLPGDEIVDFLQIENRGGIEDYFLKSTKPFYVKST